MTRKDRREGDAAAAKAKLFDSSIVGTTQQAVDFITNILESSTEYSVIAKDLTGKIVLWNEGARRLYGYEPGEVIAGQIPRFCMRRRMSRLAYLSKSWGQRSNKVSGKVRLRGNAGMASSSQRVW